MLTLISSTPSSIAASTSRSYDEAKPSPTSSRWTGAAAQMC